MDEPESVADNRAAGERPGEEASLLQRLRDEGCALRAAGEKLRCVVPDGALDEGLRALIAQHKAGLMELLRGQRVPLSFEQERLWFIDQLGGARQSAYHMPLALRIRGQLDGQALARALGMLVARHESLRTVIRSEHGVPYQEVLPAEPVKLREETLGEADLERVLADEAARPFDLENGPLTRTRLFRLAEGDHVLSLCQHHIVTDGWSTGLLLDEFTSFYDALLDGRETVIDPPAVQYADYALWQRTARWAGRTAPQEEYWRRKLDGLEGMDLTPDRPRPPVKTYRGDRLAFGIDPGTARRVRDLCATEDATGFMVLLTGLMLTLARLCETGDVRVGTPIAGRSGGDLEGTVGFFVNTLVLRAGLEGEPSFREAIRAVRGSCLEAYANAELPFGRLVDLLKADRDPSRTPLFDILFVLRQGSEGERLRLRGCEVEEVRAPYRTAKFDLAFEVTESGGGLGGEVEYNADLYSARTVEGFARYYRRMLDEGCREPDRSTAGIDLLEGARRRMLLHDFNATAREYDRSSVIEQFSARASASPDATALVLGEDSMTYQELDLASDLAAGSLASALAEERGSPPAADTVIGIPATGGFDGIVCLLGVLKAGCAYLPLDLDYPAERLAFMLCDCGARAVLAFEGRLEAEGAGRLARALGLAEDRSGEAVPVVDACGRAGEPDRKIEVHGADPGRLAYVIYTSGSTGEPKGVLVEHRGLSNLVAAQCETFRIDGSSRVLQFAPLGFDASASEIFTALVAGARLHLADDEVKRDAEALVGLMERAGITVATIPPALLRVLPHRRLKALETLVVAGDVCDTETMKRWAEGRRLVNAYGPTEATVCASMGVWSVGGSPRNIGAPMANVKLYVLDRAMRPSPPGIAGNLFISGVGLARGYAGRRNLDERKFLPNPFEEGAPGAYARMYDTGDRARWLEDGSLEFLGRSDDQVKVRGYRVEPGEIASALRGNPAVADCAVAPLDREGPTRLAAYWVARPGSEATHARDLREFLVSRLPAFMVPSVFVRLESIPLTSSGKVDRTALPRSEAAAAAAEDYREPVSPAEKKLAAIWRRVLKLEKVGVDDNFFALGGDSIMSIQVVSRARESGLEISPGDVFTSPTVASLALKAERAAPRRKRRPAASGTAPLTPIQKWFFDLDPPDPGWFNQAVLLAVDERLDAGLLRDALCRLARRHDSLRLRFARDASGDWSQSYARGSGSLEVPVSEVDLPGGARDLEAECDRVQRSLDIVNGPLAAVAIFKGMPDSRDRLLLAVHHLAVDAVSWQVLLEDLATAYAALREGKRVRFGSAGGSSFKEWGEALERYAQGPAAGQWDYWLETARGAHALHGPGEGAVSRGELHEIAIELDPEMTAALATAPGVYHCGAMEVVASAFLLAWHRTFGVRELPIDLEGHGRGEIDPGVDVSRTVGWFTSLYPVVLRVPAAGAGGPDALYSALIKDVKERLRSVPDGGLGFGALRYMSADPRAEALGRPGARVALNYLGRVDLEPAGKSKWEAEPSVPGRNISPANPATYAVEVNALVSGGRFRAGLAVNPREIPVDAADRLSQGFRAALAELIAHCGRPGAGGYTPCDFPLAPLTPAQVDALASRETETIFALTPMQEGLLFHALYAPGSDQYIEQLCWKYTGKLDPHALRRAWEGIVARHGVFRSAFFHEGLERPVQVVLREAPPEWREEDWRSVPAAELSGKLDDYIRRDRMDGFELGRAGLVRFHLIRTGDEEYRFIWCFHHILIDGWCSSLLLEELELRYRALTGGPAFELPPPRPFQDYVAWLGSRDAAGDRRFWRSLLGDVDSPTPLGIDTRPLAIHNPIDRVEEAFIRFDRGLSARVVDFARESRVTVNSVLQTAWAMVLAWYSGRPDVVLGVNVSGRPGELAGVDRMVGMFVNAVPVRFAPEADASGGDAVLKMNELMREVTAHGYGSLADVQAESLVPSGTPLFFSEYVFENYPLEESALTGLPGVSISDFRAVEKTNYPLGLMAAPGRELSIRAVYDPSCFGPGSIERMLAHIRNAVARLVEAPSSPIGTAELMEPDERESILGRWSGARVKIPGGARPGVVKSFERRAQADPGRTAISCGGDRLTYAELLGLSGAVASSLEDASAMRDVTSRGPAVGLFATRSPLAVAGIIGIMSAGATYVPMDPSHPDERLRFTARDAGLEVVLAEPALAGRLEGIVGGPGDIELLPLERSHGPARPGFPEADPDGIACIIYTSGSTGVPKGVTLSQRDLADHVAAVVNHYGMTPQDVVLQFSTLTFDASLEQIFAALAAGAGIVMRGEPLWTPAELREVLLDEGVTIMNLPTGYWAEVARDWSADPRDLSGARIRLVLPGGDALSAAAARAWKDLPLPPHGLLNAYGPTETTVTASTYEVTEGVADPVPIGKPMAGRRFYILGGDGRPVPAGVPGELCIGGIGVSPGYLDRPEATSRAFLEDPFAAEDERARGYGRMYRTGDTARWRADGEVEFLGRVDLQAKLRGFRVEPGEVEALLGRHPTVGQCAVVVRGEEERRELVAFCVPARRPVGSDLDRSRAAGEAVDAWEDVYDELFERVGVGELDTTGWNSSYDGLPIPAAQMREWVDNTVERIVGLGPSTVLEVGCGTGLILARVAPRCTGYVGVDFSGQAIARVRRWLEDEPVPGVEVYRARADELGRIFGRDDPRFPVDTAVMNSVVQYFPGPEYLEGVLEAMLDRVAAGSIFVGDVRDLRLEDAFHVSVEAAKAGRIPGAGDLRELLARDALDEKELLLAPSYFLDFARRHDRVTDVRLMPKVGVFSNEMNDYRYDVVLEVDGGGGGEPPDEAQADPREIHWEPGLDLEALLDPGTELTVSGYPNARVWVAQGLVEALESGADPADREARLSSEAREFLSLERIARMAAGSGLELHPRLSVYGERAPATYDLHFTREGVPPRVRYKEPLPARELSNRPLDRLLTEPLDPGELRAFARERLPDYMVPAAFVEIDSMPLTPTGKPDRRALEELERRHLAPATGRVPPSNERERLIADIFADVLHLEGIGIDDDFFLLGGHSLSATRAASRIARVFGVECGVRAVFEHPDVRGLASFVQERLEGRTTPRPALGHLAREGRQPLSFAQERLWFLDRFEAVGASSYHVPAAFRINGPLDVGALERSLDALVARHESLRTVFGDEGGEPFQEVRAPFHVELRILEAGGPPAPVLEGLAREAFDLETGPLFRAHLLEAGREEHLLLIDQHHIISDAWSAGILFGDLQELYAAFSHGESPDLEPIPVTYEDFAAWQKGWLTGDVLRDELGYWGRRLEGARALELPTDRPRAAGRARSGKQYPFRVDRETAGRLARTAKAAGATPFMALLAAFSFLLGRYAGRDDVVTGTVVAGRTEPVLEEIAGFFVNTLLLRVDLSGDPTFGELLERVRRTTLEAFAHQDLPYEKLVAEMRGERGAVGSPLLSTMLVYQNVPVAQLSLGGLEVTPVAIELGSVRTDLDLYAWEEGGALEMCMVYDEDLFDEATVATMAGRLVRLLGLLSDDAAARLSDVSLLEASESPVPPALPAGEGPSRAPLSYHQERLWFIDRFEEGTVYPGKPTYHNVPLVIEFEGRVDAAVLESSIRAAAAGHAALRTRIVTEGDRASQSVDEGFEPVLDVVEVRESDRPRMPEEALERARRPFGAGEEPRVRAELLRFEGGNDVLVLTVHHILVDAVSIDLLAGGIAACYSSIARGETAPRAGAPGYPAFSEWQRGVPPAGWEPLVREWTWRLRGELPILTLPEDRPRSAIHTYSAAAHDFSFGTRLCEMLADLARREGTGLEPVLMAGYVMTLLCYSGQDELVAGILHDPRPPGAEQSVGPFENLLPVRIGPHPGESFRDLIRRVAAALDEARALGSLPFELLVSQLDPPVDMSRTALFDVLFTYHPGARTGLRFALVGAHLVQTNEGLGKYDVNLLMTGGRERLEGKAVYNADIYDAGTVASMMGRMEVLLENLAGEPDRPAEEVPLLTAAEADTRSGLNATGATCREGVTVHGLFEEQARKTPGRTAVVCRDEALTYGELDRRANRLAHYLRAKGAGPGDLVALFLDRSIDAVVAMLAVLKAGGAYLPIETSFPEERVGFIVRDSSARVLVTNASLRGRLPVDAGSVIVLDEAAEPIAAMPGTPPAGGAGPGDLAYCIYTSGSTGRPKGVLVEHRNVVHLLANDRMPFEFSQDDVWTMFHSYGFDFSVWEMYGALLYGGRLVVVPVDATRDASLLLDLIQREGVTVLNQVPSAFYGLAREALDGGARALGLRYVIFGGEALDCSMLAGWHEAFPGVRLVNMYGITETCVHVTFKEVTSRDIEARTRSIGRPLPGTTVCVMDPHLRPLPEGLAGELCVGGGGVARGYLGRDGLTAERFLPDPSRPGGRLYRSGDRGRMLPEGELEYLGRIDDQVQIRGFRVEPGEIAARLAELPGVERSAVRVWESRSAQDRTGAGDVMIAAYYVPGAGTAGGQPGPDELKTALAARLPGYMVPSHVVRMDSLPMTSGGKVDRRKLPDPREVTGVPEAAVRPRDPVELRLMEIWDDLTGARTGSVESDFFLSGGHSLLAVKLVSAINRDFGTSYAVSWAFLNKTIAQQARELRSQGRSAGFRPVVAFNPAGTAPPLFFVHPGQAGAEVYAGLASLLDPEIPFYAVESRNLYDEGVPMLETVEELAQVYVEALGPYCGGGRCALGGWSFGGLVAFEMARVMSGGGMDVAGLFLLDAYCYGAGDRDLLLRLAESPGAGWLLAGDSFFEDLPDAYRARLQEAMRLEFEAMAGYVAGPYRGEVALIKPQEKQLPPDLEAAAPALARELGSRNASGDDNGWSQHVPRLETYSVPGDHITMMEGRGLKEIARILSARMRPARSR